MLGSNSRRKDRYIQIQHLWTVTFKITSQERKDLSKKLQSTKKCTESTRNLSVLKSNSKTEEKLMPDALNNQAEGYIEES